MAQYAKTQTAYARRQNPRPFSGMMNLKPGRRRSRQETGVKRPKKGEPVICDQYLSPYNGFSLNILVGD